MRWRNEALCGYNNVMRQFFNLHFVFGASALLCVAMSLSAIPAGAKERSAKPPARGNIERHRMIVHDVVPMRDGSYALVLMTESKPPRYLPIFIGETEAFAIALKLRRQQPPRPMTLNLLEEIMSSGGIQVMEVSIDGLQGGIYLGQVLLKRDKRRWQVDARPSDAVGLAVGKGAPIWVADKVLEDAAVSLEEMTEPKGRSAVDYEETL